MRQSTSITGCVGRSVGWSVCGVTHSFDDPHVARTFLICNSSFNGDKFSEFILSHKLTKRAILIYLVPISSSIKPPCNQKMIFTSRFIRPMRNFVFLSITAMFREKFCAWYQTKGDDLVYHLGRAHAWVDTQSYKNDLI